MYHLDERGIYSTRMLLLSSPSRDNKIIACLLPHVSVGISPKREPCDLSPVENIPSECEASERECTELDDGVLHYGVNITTSRSDLFITQHLGVNQNITSLLFLFSRRSPFVVNKARRSQKARLDSLINPRRSWRQYHQT